MRQQKLCCRLGAWRGEESEVQHTNAICIILASGTTRNSLLSSNFDIILSNIFSCYYLSLWPFSSTTLGKYNTIIFLFGNINFSKYKSKKIFQRDPIPLDILIADSILPVPAYREERNVSTPILPQTTYVDSFNGLLDYGLTGIAFTVHIFLSLMYYSIANGLIQYSITLTNNTYIIRFYSRRHYHSWGSYWSCIPSMRGRVWFWKPIFWR